MTDLLGTITNLAADGWTVNLSGPNHDGTWYAIITKRVYHREIPPYFAAGRCRHTDLIHAVTQAAINGEADIKAIAMLPNPKPKPVPKLTDLLAPVLTTTPTREPTRYATGFRRFG